MAIFYVPPSSGGVSDYNDLINAPIKDNRKMKEYNLVFSGDYKDYELLNLDEDEPSSTYGTVGGEDYDFFYGLLRLSDECPEIENISSDITVGIYFEGLDEYIYPLDQIYSYGNGLYALSELAVLVPNDLENGVKEGIYSAYIREGQLEMYVSSIEFTSSVGEVKKLDNIFLQDDLVIGTKGNEQDFISPSSLDENNITDNPDDKVQAMDISIEKDSYSLIVGHGNLAKQHCVAFGYKSGAKGIASYAQGYQVKAEGDFSHAEGHTTFTYEEGSHAEGVESCAYGYGSHAEGVNTHCFGEGSHTEGYETSTSSFACHAEGYDTSAVGQYSHAEGSKTRAGKNNSHAEGWGTDANTDCQHTQGKFNLIDYDERYAHIVGNGTAYDDRSNAHTLDWNGNGWYQGGLYVGGTSQDDAKKVLNTSDIYFDADGNLVVSINGVTKKFSPM